MKNNTQQTEEIRILSDMELYITKILSSLKELKILKQEEQFGRENLKNQIPEFSPKVSAQKKFSDRTLLTRKETAEYLGVTHGTLAGWACTKKYNLPFIKIGRLVKYKKVDLDAFIDRRRKVSHSSNSN
jgi:excisionase family DNA binding protein